MRRWPGRTTRRRRKYATFARSAQTLSECPRFRKRLQRATSGRIFGGCNVENATYGLTVCAERVAIFKAISEGERGFDAICVVTDTDTLTPPCGACRQLIWEFCGDVPVIMANLKGKIEVIQMKELFPKPFDSSNL